MKAEDIFTYHSAYTPFQSKFYFSFTVGVFSLLTSTTVD